MKKKEELRYLKEALMHGRRYEDTGSLNILEMIVFYNFLKSENALMKYVRLSLMNRTKKLEFNPKYFIIGAFYWNVEGEREYWNQLDNKWEQLISQKVKDGILEKR